LNRQLTELTPKHLLQTILSVRTQFKRSSKTLIQTQHLYHHLKGNLILLNIDLNHHLHYQIVKKIFPIIYSTGFRTLNDYS